MQDTKYLKGKLKEIIDSKETDTREKLESIRILKSIVEFEQNQFKGLLSKSRINDYPYLGHPTVSYTLMR